MDRLRLALATIFVVLAIAPIGAEAAPQCKKGIPCGNSCISADKVCHISAAAPAPAAVGPTATQRQKLEECYVRADARKLAGAAWQSFMLDCSRP
jgi:hypothetical protein